LITIEAERRNILMVGLWVEHTVHKGSGAIYTETIVCVWII